MNAYLVCLSKIVEGEMGIISQRGLAEIIKKDCCSIFYPVMNWATGHVPFDSKQRNF